MPDGIRHMITEMVAVARYENGTYDDVSKTTSQAFNGQTAQSYEAALIALARAAAETGKVDLATLNCLDPLFASDVRRTAIARWTDLEAIDAGFSARTAADYVRIIGQIGRANGIKTKKWRKNLKRNPFLHDGLASADKMSPKNQRFCERLVHEPADVRTFLTQHLRYQDMAGDILATDKPLPLDALRAARRLGTCAAFAALEIRGAGIRKGSALAAHATGTGQNLLRREAAGKRWFELRIAVKDMKGEYVEMPPIPIHDDKYCGYDVLDWYLQYIRPLFNFANPDWCEENKRARTPYLFPSEQSAAPLRGSVLYKWITRSSADIGLAMSPHNFRHGFATLLLARSWGNRGRAAAYLGCSVRVLDTYYAWLDKRQKLEETQDLLAEALAA